MDKYFEEQYEDKYSGFSDKYEESNGSKISSNVSTKTTTNLNTETIPEYQEKLEFIKELSKEEDAKTKYKAYLLVKGESKEDTEYNFTSEDRTTLAKEHSALYTKVLNLPIEILMLPDAGMHAGMDTENSNQLIVDLLEAPETWKNLDRVELALKVIGQANIPQNGSEGVKRDVLYAVNNNYSEQSLEKQDELDEYLLPYFKKDEEAGKITWSWKSIDKSDIFEQKVYNPEGKKGIAGAGLAVKKDAKEAAKVETDYLKTKLKEAKKKRRAAKKEGKKGKELKPYNDDVTLLRKLVKESKNTSWHGLLFGFLIFNKKLHFTELSLITLQESTYFGGQMFGVQFKKPDPKKLSPEELELAKEDNKINYDQDNKKGLISITVENLPFDSINYFDSRFGFRSDEGHFKGIDAQLNWQPSPKGKKKKERKNDLISGTFKADIEQIEFNNLRYISEKSTSAIGKLTINGIKIELSKAIDIEGDLRLHNMAMKMTEMLPNMGNLLSVAIFSIMEQMTPAKGLDSSAMTALQDLLAIELYENLDLKFSFTSLSISNFIDTQNGFIGNVELGATEIGVSTVEEKEGTKNKSYHKEKEKLEDIREALNAAKAKRTKKIGKRKYDKINKEIEGTEASEGETSKKGLQEKYNDQLAIVKKLETNRELNVDISTDKIQLDNAQMIEGIVKSNFEEQLNTYGLEGIQGLGDIRIEGDAKIKTKISPKGTTETVMKLPVHIDELKSSTFQYKDYQLSGTDMAATDVLVNVVVIPADLKAEHYGESEDKQKERNPIEKVDIQRINIGNMSLATMSMVYEGNTLELGRDINLKSVDIYSIVLDDKSEVNTDNLTLEVKEITGKSSLGVGLNGELKSVGDDLVDLGIKDLLMFSQTEVIGDETINTMTISAGDGHVQNISAANHEVEIGINSIQYSTSTTSDTESKAKKSEQTQFAIQLSHIKTPSILYGEKGSATYIHSNSPVNIKGVTLQVTMNSKVDENQEMQSESTTIDNFHIKELSGHNIHAVKDDIKIDALGLTRLKGLEIKGFKLGDPINLNTMKLINFDEFEMRKLVARITKLGHVKAENISFKYVEESDSYAYSADTIGGKGTYEKDGNGMKGSFEDATLDGKFSKDGFMSANLALPKGIVIPEIAWKDNKGTIINSYKNPVLIDNINGQFSFKLDKDFNPSDVQLNLLSIGEISASGLWIKYGDVDLKLPKLSPVSIQNIRFEDIKYDLEKSGMDAITGSITTGKVDFQKLAINMGSFVGNRISLNPSIVAESLHLSKGPSGFTFTAKDPKVWLEEVEYKDYNGSIGELSQHLVNDKTNAVKQDDIWINLTKNISDGSHPLFSAGEVIVDMNTMKTIIRNPVLYKVMIPVSNSTGIVEYTLEGKINGDFIVKNEGGVMTLGNEEQEIIIENLEISMDDNRRVTPTSGEFDNELEIVDDYRSTSKKDRNQFGFLDAAVDGDLSLSLFGETHNMRIVVGKRDWGRTEIPGLVNLASLVEFVEKKAEQVTSLGIFTTMGALSIEQKLIVDALAKGLAVDLEADIDDLKSLWGHKYPAYVIQASIIDKNVFTLFPLGGDDVFKMNGQRYIKLSSLLNYQLNKGGLRDAEPLEISDYYDYFNLFMAFGGNPTFEVSDLEMNLSKLDYKHGQKLSDTEAKNQKGWLQYLEDSPIFTISMKAALSEDIRQGTTGDRTLGPEISIPNFNIPAFTASINDTTTVKSKSVSGSLDIKFKDIEDMGNVNMQITDAKLNGFSITLKKVIEDGQ